MFYFVTGFEIAELGGQIPVFEQFIGMIGQIGVPAVAGIAVNWIQRLGDAGAGAVAEIATMQETAAKPPIVAG